MFDTYSTIIQCLHNQYQVTIHKDYHAKLDNPDIGLTNVLPRDIYNHIIDCYAKINLKMAENNKAKFQEPLDPTKLLVVYIKNKSDPSLCSKHGESNHHGMYGANGSDACHSNRTDERHVS